MSHMRCELVDIEEAVDMYNLDVEECRSCLTRKTISSSAIPQEFRTPRGGMRD